MTEKIGKCHICSQHGALTFEHIPPKSAFNSYSDLISYKFDGASKHWVPSKENPYGVGAYTLCASCNNNTGGTYGQAFCDLISTIADQTKSVTEYRKDVEVFYNGFLHRVFKQIVTMFCSTNGPDFIGKHNGLREYLLDQSSERFPEGIYLYTYLVNRASKFATGCQGILNLRTNESVVCSEILFWPLGYIMSSSELKSEDIKNAKLTNITHWAKYSINLRQKETIKLAKNYRLLMFPMDFRSKDEIEKESGCPIKAPGLFPFVDYEI